MRTRSCHSLGAIVLAVLSLSCGATLAGPPEIVRGEKKTKRASPWLDLASGLKKSRKSHQPLLILYTASREPAVEADKVADLAATFESYLRNKGFKRSLRDYVLVGLDSADLDEPFPPRVDHGRLLIDDHGRSHGVVGVQFSCPATRSSSLDLSG